MAFLVDEFGAFEGVVTATDLLEMIAGDFDEGHDDAEVLCGQREDGSWLVDGQTDLDELADELGEDFGEADGFHTVAGLVLHQLSRVPDEGEILQLGRFEVEVIDMDDRRIDKLLFRQVMATPKTRRGRSRPSTRTDRRSGYRHKAVLENPAVVGHTPGLARPKRAPGNTLWRAVVSTGRS
jgi:Mg2+/Co2+ transporter CorC